MLWSKSKNKKHQTTQGRVQVFLENSVLIFNKRLTFHLLQEIHSSTFYKKASFSPFLKEPHLFLKRFGQHFSQVIHSTPFSPKKFILHLFLPRKFIPSISVYMIYENILISSYIVTRVKRHPKRFWVKTKNTKLRKEPFKSF